MAVSFDIRRGENLGLVGESGCGKSTLARAILGLEPVEDGRIELDGQPVFDGHGVNRVVRRRMQVVFQDPYGSFNPRWSVARLVAEPLYLVDDPPKGAARKAAVAEALTSVGLKPEDGARYIHEFSGGQRQRIALARAFDHPPRSDRAGRGGERAGCVDPRADAGPAGRSEHAAGADLSVHQP